MPNIGAKSFWIIIVPEPTWYSGSH